MSFELPYFYLIAQIIHHIASTTIRFLYLRGLRWLPLNALRVKILPHLTNFRPLMSLFYKNIVMCTQLEWTTGSFSHSTRELTVTA